MAHLNWSPCPELVSMLLQPLQRTSSSLTATGGVPTTVVGTAPRITIVAGLYMGEYRRGIEEYPTIGGTTTTITNGMAALGTTSMCRQDRQVVLMVGMAAGGSKISSLSSTTDPRLRGVTNPSSSMEALLRGATDPTNNFTHPT